jgi:uncharacterized membrane protein
MSDSNPGHGLSIHRIDALTDGIYAVAMTLLVIELKLPDHSLIHSPADLSAAVLQLWPKFYAWVISFLVLGIFWMGHHRAHNHVHRGDGQLVALNIGQLAFVSLMPFSCALLGEHPGLLSQTIYSINMGLLAVFALLVATHIHAHPELSALPMQRGTYNGARIRIGGLILVSVAAPIIQWLLPEGRGAGNMAFVLMAVISPLSRRAERASGPAVPNPAPG